MFKLIVFTNRHLVKGDLINKLERLCEAGADRIVLREKDLSEDEYFSLALKAFGKIKEKLTIHTHYKVAVKLGVKSVHLPLEDFLKMSAEDKAFFSEIGVSCHSYYDAKSAESAAASYITVGHIYETDSKKGLRPRGAQLIKEITSLVGLPVYAIGGVSPDKINELLSSGASGACVMSSAMKAYSEVDFVKSFFAPLDLREKLKLYAVASSPLTSEELLLDGVKKVLQSGARIVQLRLKETPREKIKEIGLKVKALCASFSALFILNDDYSLALEIGADGVHVGQSDESVSSVRANAPGGFIIGATAKTVEQARKAEEMGADYIGSGAVFKTKTKGNALPLKLEDLKLITSSVNIPVVAIGGINETNASSLGGLGISGIAVSEGLFKSGNAASSTKKLLEIAEKIIK